MGISHTPRRSEGRRRSAHPAPTSPTQAPLKSGFDVRCELLEGLRRSRACAPVHPGRDIFQVNLSPRLDTPLRAPPWAHAPVPTRLYFSTTRRTAVRRPQAICSSGPDARSSLRRCHAASLPGITRATVLELVGPLGVRAEQRALELSELLNAEEALLTSSLRAVAPLVPMAPARLARHAQRAHASDRAGLQRPCGTGVRRMSAAPRR